MASDNVRNQILEAAGPIFAECGYKGATVREICSTAGVNVAAVNYYFGDKSHLYVATVEQAHRLRSSEIPLPNWTDEDSAEDKLLGFLKTLLERMIGAREVPWPTQLMMREILSPTDACRTLVQNYFRPQFELLLSIIDEFVAAELPESQRHQLAFSVIGQCFFYRAAGEVIPMLITKKELKSKFSVDQLARHICNTMLPALHALQSAPPATIRRK